MNFFSLKNKIIKRFKYLEKQFILTKRQQLVIITLFLTFGLILTQIVSIEYRYRFVIGLSIVTYLLSALGLREDLKKVEWISLLSLPTLFTAAIALFYFLLPVRWLTRVPVAFFYAVCMYALLLTENIYNVAANRTIGLLRAAHTVGFLLTLIAYFLLLQTVLAFKMPFFINSMIVGLISVILVFQTLWAHELEEQVSDKIKNLTLAIVLVLIELVWVLSFWPVKITIHALFLTTVFYSLTGMAQQYISDRLYKKTMLEFLIVSAVVFLLLLLTVNWRPGL